VIDCYRHGNFKKKYFEEGQAINKIQFIGTIFIILTLLVVGIGFYWIARRHDK